MGPLNKLHKRKQNITFMLKYNIFPQKIKVALFPFVDETALFTPSFAEIYLDERQEK